jgi:hypothetical protein
MQWPRGGRPEFNAQWGERWRLHPSNEHLLPEDGNKTVFRNIAVLAKASAMDNINTSYGGHTKHSEMKAFFFCHHVQTGSGLHPMST